MPKIAMAINKFNYGEVSPLMAGRVDLAKYQSGCKVMENFIPLLQGPVRRRGGTRFIAKSGNGARPAALIDFAFSETTSYVIEAGDGYLRFFNHGAPVLNEAGEIYQIASPWRQADLFLENGICAFKYVQTGDVLYVVCPTAPPQKIMRYGRADWRVETLAGWSGRPSKAAMSFKVPGTGDTITIDLVSLLFRFFKDGFPILAEPASQYAAPDKMYTLKHPWTLDDLFNADGSTNLRYWQESNKLYIDVAGAADPDKQFRCLIKQTRYVDDDPLDHDDPNNPNDDPEKEEDDAGTYIVVDNNWVLSKVSRWPSNLPPLAQWKLPDLNQWAPRPNPNAVALYRERLCMAAGQVVYMSQSGAFDNFELTEVIKDADGRVQVPIASDDPLEISVYSEKMDLIQWLCPSGDDLLVGTQGGEFLISQSTAVDPLGPENVKVSPGTSSTSSAVQALRVGSVVMFSRRSGLKIDQFFFDYSGDSYESTDITKASEHITEGGITALAWQSEPVETLLAIRRDGQLLGFTYSKEEEMAAWYRLVMGGGGKVSALAVIPASLGGRDQVWLSVEREINGETVHYIETMEAGHEAGGDVSECFYVDCGATVRVDAPVWEVGGLEHLEGCEVAILADGGVLPNRVVRGGVVDLQDGAEKIVHVGLPYSSVLTTVNLELQMPDGTSQGRKKRFTSTRLRLLESMGGAAGPSLGRLDTLEFRTPNDRMDVGVPLFSGDVKVSWPGGYELDGSLTVKQEYPLPFTLLAIFPNVLMEGLE